MRRLGKVGMRVEDLLRENARRFGARTALVASKRRLSYAELDRMSDHLSDALKAAGVARGDSVVVVMENCWEAVVALFAALKAGAVFCPADPENPAEGLSTFVAKNQPSAVVTQTRLASAVGAAVAGAQSVRLVVLARGEAAPAGSGCVRFEDIVSRTRHPAESRDEVADTEPAMRIDVAGPSGSSHDVVLAHRDLTGAAATVIRHLEDREDETVLVALPPGTEELDSRTACDRGARRSPCSRETFPFRARPLQPSWRGAGHLPCGRAPVGGDASRSRGHPFGAVPGPSVHAGRFRERSVGGPGIGPRRGPAVDASDTGRRGAQARGESGDR